jgi:type III secretory pathway component EscT
MLDYNFELMITTKEGLTLSKMTYSFTPPRLISSNSTLGLLFQEFYLLPFKTNARSLTKLNEHWRGRFSKNP